MPKTIADKYDGEWSSYVISDLHVNALVSPCPPRVPLDRGGTYIPSKGQRELTAALHNLSQRIKNDPRNKVVFLNGDLIEDAEKEPKVTTNKSVALEMLIRLLMPITKEVDRIVIIRGTAYHTGLAQWIEEEYAKVLDMVYPGKLVKDTDNDSASFYWFSGIVGQTKLDIAHHYPMGALQWTFGNSANRLATEAIYYYVADMGYPAPDYVIRSHNHRYADSGRTHRPRGKVCKAMFTPGFTLKTDFVYKKGKQFVPGHVGAIAIQCNPDGTATDDLIEYRYKTGGKPWKTII